MKKEIEQIIRENLPQQTAGELKKVLAEYEKLKVEVQELKVENKALHSANSEISQALQTFQTREGELLRREEEVEIHATNVGKEARVLQIKMLEKELECMKQSKQDIYNLSSIFFRKLDASDFVENKTVFKNYEQTSEWNNTTQSYIEKEVGETITTTVEEK